MKKIVFVIIAVVFAVIAVIILSRFTKNKTPENPPVTQKTAVRIYLVKLEDNGAVGEKIGCGDSIIPVSEEIVVSGDPIQESIEKLLSIKNSDIQDQGLYTAFSNSKLSVEKVEIDGTVAKIYLTGNLSLGGVCDSPRVQNQLEKTALQIPEVQTVEIYINNIPLAEILSEK